MCVKVLHLKKSLTSDITLPNNCFYIGNEFLNLAKSPFYMELEANQYRQWLWCQIKNKTLLYLELKVIVNSIILGNEIILACSCNKANQCNGLVIKKAIAYLIEQEKLEAQDVQSSSWSDYKESFPINDDKSHDFSLWLNQNNCYQETANFYHLWLNYISSSL